MLSRRISPKVCAGLAILCLIIAIISFSGIILTEDYVGRTIFGMTWIFVAICWFGWYFQARKKT